MSEAYERERQNNSRLDELASKVSALRGVTVDIYDNARDTRVIDHSNEVFADMGTSLRNTVGRVKLMAQSSNKIQIFKLAGSIVAVILVLWWLWSWIS